MTDAPKNLDEFFNRQKGAAKPKRTRKPKAQQDVQAAADESTNAAATVEQKQPAPEPAKPEPVKSNFVDSDEEADADVVLDQNQQSKLTDTKDTQAAKKQKDRAEMAENGWKSKDIFGTKETKEEPKPTAASTAPAKTDKGPGGINFGNKPMSFNNNKPKGIIDKQSFPDFDDIGKKKDKPAVLKKDMGYSMGDSGSSAAAPSFKNSKKDDNMTMPVFKGKLNLNSGTTAEEIMNSKQNYDMSQFKMSSSAAVKSSSRGGASGRGRGRGEGNRGGGFDGDDDFEVVTEKKRAPRKQYGGNDNFAFGSEKPSFNRGQ